MNFVMINLTLFIFLQALEYTDTQQNISQEQGECLENVLTSVA